MKKHRKKSLLAIGLVAASLLAGGVVLSPDNRGGSPANPGNEGGASTASGRTNSSSASKASPGGSNVNQSIFDAAASSATNQYGNILLSKINSQKSPLPDRRVGEYVVDAAGATYPVRVYQTLAMPNDPLASQWWVNATNLSSAWDVPAGSTQTTLAIIDTGFALKHEEFNGRWYQNTGETGSTASENPSLLNCTDQGRALDKSCNLIDDDFDGIVDNETGPATRQNPSLLNCTGQGRALDKSCNLIDDDNNGLVDDVTGWDFANFYPSPQAGKTNPAGSSVTHGTSVAGIAAATGNNARGIAGVDWHTKILPIQAISDDGYGDTLTVSRAIRYAADQGADVISLSLGTPSPDDYMRQAMAYAISKGSIIVAAAGNDGCDCMVYPAHYDEAVAVGATDSGNLRTYFSSYGSALDVVAPGVNMTSSTWTSGNGTTAYASNLAGTSFSTPLVAGLLSLARSHQPQASAAQLVGALTETTNRLSIPGLSSRNDSLGYGLANALAALSRASGVMSPVQRYAFSPVSGGSALGNFEPLKSFQVYQCESGRPGSTNVYKLTKGSDVVYTTSFVEVYKAAVLGYTNSVLSGGFCINLPTDQPQSIRSLSIPAELENRPPK